jgi:hypothetical protein
MIALRFVYLLALAVWTGGLFVLGGVTAPSLFDTLQARAPEAGRVLAGAAFGAVLTRFHHVAYGCAAAMLLTLVGMALVGPRPRPYAPRLAVIGSMLALTAVVGFPVQQRLEHLQASIRGPVSALPDNDPRKAEFGRWHGVSNGLLGATAVAALALLFWEARETRG